MVRIKREKAGKESIAFIEKNSFAFQYNQDSKRKIELRTKSAKQVANSYFYTWKKTKEENNTLLYLLALIVRSRYS